MSVLSECSYDELFDLEHIKKLLWEDDRVTGVFTGCCSSTKEGITAHIEEVLYDDSFLRDAHICGIDHYVIEEDRKLAGYNLIVTSETQLTAGYIYSAYHNLWRIEESFRVMKSQLDARPVYLQKKETITGHFLICYLSVLLLRLLQFKELKNEFSTEELMDFTRSFKAVKISDRKYINLLRSSDLINRLADKTNLPLKNYYLSLTDIKNVLNHRFRSAV